MSLTNLSVLSPGLRAVFRPVFNLANCDGCGICAVECSFNEIKMETIRGKKIPVANGKACGACHRCEYTCPLGAISIEERNIPLRSHGLWQYDAINRIHLQAASGAVALTGFGAGTNIPKYFDKILFNACQVTNPSIDPQREPMETITYLGKKVASLEEVEDLHNFKNSLLSLTPLYKK